MGHRCDEDAPAGGAAGTVAGVEPIEARRERPRVAGGGGPLRPALRAVGERAALPAAEPGCARRDRHAARDPSHRGADDGEPLVRQLPGGTRPRRWLAAGRRRHTRRHQSDGRRSTRRVPSFVHDEAASTRPDPGVGRERAERWARVTAATDGFVRSAARRRPTWIPPWRWVTRDEADLPFYYGLARTFRSRTGGSRPASAPRSRTGGCLVAGTANGLTTDRITHTFDQPANGRCRDMLTSHRISWADYHPIPHVGPTLRKAALGVRRSAGLSRRAGGIVRIAGSHLRDVDVEAKSFLQFTADAYPLGILRYIAHVHSIDRFMSDARRAPAVGQHRRPGLPRELRGEPAGHPARRSVRGRGRQRGHVRRRDGCTRCSSGSTTSTVATTTTCHRRGRRARRSTRRMGGGPMAESTVTGSGCPP